MKEGAERHLQKSSIHLYRKNGNEDKPLQLVES